MVQPGRGKSGGLYFFRGVSGINERLLRDIQTLPLQFEQIRAHQALREIKVQRRGHQEGLDAHVHQNG